MKEYLIWKLIKTIWWKGYISNNWNNFEIKLANYTENLS